MFELIKIEKRQIGNEIVDTVSGRDLWTKLEVQDKFADWIVRNLKMFSESQDFQCFLVKQKSGAVIRNIKEYALLIDVAKHIAMLSRTEKGMEIRNYFIEVEKISKELYKSKLRKKMSYPVMETTKAKIILQDNLDVCEMFNIPTHIAQIESVKATELTTGVDFSPLLLKAPAQTDIKEQDVMLKPTELGKKLDLSAIKLNQLLQEKGFQYKNNKTWIPTQTGKQFCEKHSWKKGGKSGYNLKWNLKKIEMIIDN